MGKGSIRSIPVQMPENAFRPSGELNKKNCKAHQSFTGQVQEGKVSTFNLLIIEEIKALVI